MVMNRPFENPASEALKKLSGSRVIAMEYRVSRFDPLGDALGQVLLDRLRREFPIERDRSAKGLGVFLFKSNSHQVLLAFRQINVLESDVVKLLGSRAAVE